MIIFNCPVQKYRFFTLPEFLAAEFPPSAPEADQFSGAGIVDVVFIKPNSARAGKLLLVIPLNAAELLQHGERIRSLDPGKVTYCVAPADSLDADDIAEIVTTAPQLNGLYVDLNVCTPQHRAQIRALPVTSLNVEHVIRASKAGRN